MLSFKIRIIVRFKIIRAQRHFPIFIRLVISASETDSIDFKSEQSRIRTLAVKN